MKKYIFAGFAICMIFVLTACGSSKETISEMEVDINETKAPKHEQQIKETSKLDEKIILTTLVETDLISEKKAYLPGAEFDVITFISKGKELELIEQGVEWHKVLYDGNEGYVLSMDVEDITPLPSPYYVYIEKGSHTINIYEMDEKGEYSKLIKTYLTATGITAGKTPTGVFSVSKKYEWKQFDSAGEEKPFSYSPYVVEFTEGIYMHGPVFAEMDFNTMYGNTYKEIGTNSTAGCMRTNVGAAYFIYMNCPIGTIVEVVNGSPREIETPELIKAFHDIEKGRYYDPTDPNGENPIEP